VTTTLGNVGGVYTRLFAFGGRSFAVWDTGGRLIFDSGKKIEKVLSTRFPGFFADSRSDDKGPEPEDLTLGTVGGRPYLFVGLERADGVAAFDVSVPGDPRFAAFIDGGDCPTATAARPCHMPERLAFVPPRGGSSGEVLPPLLLVTNELSATTAAYALQPRR
jgi:5'-nucleotidase